MTKIAEIVQAMANIAVIERSEGDNCFVDNWPEIARAAVEAMREPTEAMISSGYGVWWGSDGHDDSRAIWPAMIDTILTEKPE